MSLPYSVQASTTRLSMSATHRKETNSLLNRNRQGLGKKAMLLGLETVTALGHELFSPHLRESVLEQWENAVRIKLILSYIRF